MFLAVTKARGFGRGRKAHRLQFIDKGFQSSEQARPFMCCRVLYTAVFRELLASCGQPTVSLVAFIRFYPRNRDARNTLRLCGFASNRRPQGMMGTTSFVAGKECDA
jgi:hypothetical protein